MYMNRVRTIAKIQSKTRMLTELRDALTHIDGMQNIAKKVQVPHTNNCQNNGCQSWTQIINYS